MCLLPGVICILPMWDDIIVCWGRCGETRSIGNGLAATKPITASSSSITKSSSPDGRWQTASQRGFSGEAVVCFFNERADGCPLPLSRADSNSDSNLGALTRTYLNSQTAQALENPSLAQKHKRRGTGVLQLDSP